VWFWSTIPSSVATTSRKIVSHGSRGRRHRKSRAHQLPPTISRATTAWTRPRREELIASSNRPEKSASSWAPIRWGYVSLPGGAAQSAIRGEVLYVLFTGVIRRIWCSLQVRETLPNGKSANIPQQRHGSASAERRLWWNMKVEKKKKRRSKRPVKTKIQREIIDWFGRPVFLLINGTIGQARVIPSARGEHTAHRRSPHS